MLCLDTTFLIDLLKKREDACRKFQEIEDEELGTTQINVYEIKAGIYRRIGTEMDNGQLKLFNQMIASLGMMPLDTGAIDEAAKINGKLTHKGEIINDLDILIAGICIANNCKTIVTKNKKHFERIDGLEVETY
mgnify:CR=1 FL=1